ncbi:MAG: hypothetical protein QOJ35_182 [Solirubrobacteraceae bacterium]|jgi:hypothetical protein|nr:hypothetical protein [Solirubrobacteraceae bacterium]
MQRLAPYGAALVVGVIAGAIAHSPIVAGLAALVSASIWAGVERRRP